MLEQAIFARITVELEQWHLHNSSYRDEIGSNTLFYSSESVRGPIRYANIYMPTYTIIEVATTSNSEDDIPHHIVKSYNIQDPAFNPSDIALIIRKWLTWDTVFDKERADTSEEPDSFRRFGRGQGKSVTSPR